MPRGVTGLVLDDVRTAHDIIAMLRPGARGQPAGDRTAARGGPGSDSGQVTARVASHFTAKTVGGSTVYDLTAPGAGSAP